MTSLTAMTAPIRNASTLNTACCFCAVHAGRPQDPHAILHNVFFLEITGFISRKWNLARGDKSTMTLHIVWCYWSQYSQLTNKTRIWSFLHSMLSLNIYYVYVCRSLPCMRNELTNNNKKKNTAVCKGHMIDYNAFLFLSLLLICYFSTNKNIPCAVLTPFIHITSFFMLFFFTTQIQWC